MEILRAGVVDQKSYGCYQSVALQQSLPFHEVQIQPAYIKILNILDNVRQPSLVKDVY